jgi:hypothetical protein
MSEIEDNELDPRIQIELEKLNTTTDEINRLEIEYDVNSTFFLLEFRIYELVAGSQYNVPNAVERVNAKAESAVQKTR